MGQGTKFLPSPAPQVKYNFPNYYYKNVSSDNFLFTVVDSIFLSGNILHAYNKKGNCPLFMYQDSLVTLQHTCNHPCVYVTERKGIKTRIKLSTTLFTLYPYKQTKSVCYDGG
jgi:hypothetical protein